MSGFRGIANFGICVDSTLWRNISEFTFRSVQLTSCQSKFNNFTITILTVLQLIECSIQSKSFKVFAFKRSALRERPEVEW